MPAKLSTHVLDTSSGRPAAGVTVEVFSSEGHIATATTNADGRCDAPLLEGDAMFDGECRLEFHIGDYFRSAGIESPFLDVVPVVFQLQADVSFHVPLVCTPWSYSTYRGS